MKWCRVEVGGRTIHAILDDSHLLEIDASPLGPYRKTSQRHKLEDVRFLPPIIPPTFYAAGSNYAFHIDWAKKYHGMSALKVPTQADVGYRAITALVGSGANVVIPADSTGPFEYEGELVAVIGKKAKHLSEAEALGCVAGYTLGNDLSERTWQKADRTLWRCKDTDTFKPMGPFVTDGIDPMNQTIEVKINGRVVSSYNTSAMVFRAAHWISNMSRYRTLYPGDILWFGCDGATIPALVPGDTVEVFNEAIGSLVNPIVREEAR